MMVVRGGEGGVERGGGGGQLVHLCTQINTFHLR